MTLNSERSEESLSRRTLYVFVLTLLLVCIANTTAIACPSCFGDPSSAEVQATKWAIIALLGVTGTVLVGVGSFFLYLRKRADELNARFVNRLN